jgi:hypothetical protein
LKWLDLAKFLKGKPPKTVTQNVSNGNAVQIENASGEVQVVNGNVYNFFIGTDVAQDVAKLKLPVKRGATALEAYRGDKKIASYSGHDLSKLKPIKPFKDGLKSEIKTIVEVTAPEFDDEGEWRLKHGRKKLTARLLDEDFKAKMQRGQERIRDGDRLDVQLRAIREKEGTKTRTKYFIVKINRRV